MSTNRWANAQCRGRSDLPWTEDITPDQEQLDQMAEVCTACPIRIDCALHALTTTPAVGGFYAGRWHPWKKTDSVLGTTDIARAVTLLNA